MNPLAPAADLLRAFTFPFKMLFVVGLCAFINWFTTPGHWWFQWVAFGMGIALLCIWARALRTLIGAGLLAGIGYLAYRWWKRRESGSTNSARTSQASR